jgi:hypothetical protein
MEEQCDQAIKTKTTMHMKQFIILLPALLLLACSPQTQKPNDTLVPKSDAPVNTSATVPDFNVAVQFMNAYTAYCMQPGDANWIEKQPLLTDNFKATHKKLLEDALKEDPEMGLGFDPIFDAQDFPDKGFTLSKTDTANGYVTVSGNGWPDFYVVLKVVRQGDQSFVDGAGVINIPQDKRAKR